MICWRCGKATACSFLLLSDPFSLCRKEEPAQWVASERMPMDTVGVRVHAPAVSAWAVAMWIRGSRFVCPMAVIERKSLKKLDNDCLEFFVNQPAPAWKICRHRANLTNITINKILSTTHCLRRWSLHENAESSGIKKYMVFHCRPVTTAGSAGGIAPPRPTWNLTPIKL